MSATSSGLPPLSAQSYVTERFAVAYAQSHVADRSTQQVRKWEGHYFDLGLVPLLDDADQLDAHCIQLRLHILQVLRLLPTQHCT